MTFISPGQVNFIWQAVVQVWEGDAILCSDWLSNNDLVDVIEFIPVLVPTKEIVTACETESQYLLIKAEKFLVPVPSYQFVC